MTGVTGSVGSGGEAVAIVSIGCRFPGGVRSAEDLWDLVSAGRDAIGDYPQDREWPGKITLSDPDGSAAGYQQAGGFIDGVADFDPTPFRISPREALAMDPQQRLLLETAWEAIERARIAPSALRGTDTAVYVGSVASDYLPGLAEMPAATGTFGLTGGAASVVSGRLSYVLGLNGPSLTVDTACSSSLVALHLAVRALRGGECGLALAAGSTVLATPGIFTEFARQGGLAADGRCKAFSDQADGTGWSEGVAVLVLERLADAERQGHPVLAVIRGSAVNSDGASNGLTAPNGRAQQRVIQAALADAGLRAADVDAVEAHGTGTRLGDPIEAQALIATYGRDRDAGSPLWLGSVKSNIGHSQAAAGLAGVIKTVMAMRAGLLPATLHADPPTSRVRWQGVRVLTEAVSWPAGDRPRRAAVSAFGISGTNVHVVLEEAPSGPERLRDRDSDGPVAWVLGAAQISGLAGQAAALADRLAAGGPRPDPADVAFSLASTRAPQPARAVLVGGDLDTFISQLSAFGSQGEAGPVIGTARPVGGVVFVYPGQGAQWAGMGRALIGENDVFAARMRECADALAPHLGFALLDALDDEEALRRVDVVQPALFAVMLGLTEVWRAYGVRPEAVAGHSQGEIAAAVVAGALSLEDGAAVVALRSRALTGLAGQGGMLSVAIGADQAQADLVRWSGDLDLAVVNSPSAVVLSGTVPALRSAQEFYDSRAVRTRMLPVDYASHSAAVESLEQRLLAELSSISPGPTHLPFISAVTGEEIEGKRLDAGYWYENLRRTVRFDRATQTLAAQGYGPFVEVSPHPVLTTPIAETLESLESLDEGATAASVLGTLRRDDGGATRMLTALGQAYVAGVDVDWAAGLAGRPARAIDLPTYAFSRQRFWLKRTPVAGPGEPDWFWNCVTGADLDTLTGRLGLDDEQSRALEQVLPALARHRRATDGSDAGAGRYRIGWVPWSPAPVERLGERRLLLAEPGSAFAGQLEAALRAVGSDVVVTSWPDRPEREAAAVVLAEFPGLSGILALPGPGPDGLLRIITLLQAMDDAEVEAPLWALTRAAVSAGAAEGPVDPSAALVWGLGPVAAVERPLQWGGLIDLPSEVSVTDDVVAGRVAGVLAAAGPEDQIAVRTAGTFVRRLRPAPAQSGSGTWQPSGTVLVTGGTGGLGAQTARWVAAHRDHQRPLLLILLSRRGPEAPGAADLVAELETDGVKVLPVAGDVADRDFLAGLLAGLDTDRPLTAVLHTAAELADGSLGTITPEQVRAALRAKADGAALLDELTRSADLEAFVLFSSVAGTFGIAGQAGYAPGNAYLDALAHRRRSEGLPALSVGWGAWAGSGMAEGEQGRMLRRHGMPAMDPERALAALGRALADDETAVLVADIDWARYRVALTATRPSPLIQDLFGDPAPTADPDGTRPADLRRLASVPPEQRRQVLAGLVREHTAAVLGHATGAEVETDVAFRVLGMDSVTGVELRNRLSAGTGLRLPIGLIYDCPTPDAIVDRLWPEVAAALAGEDAPAPETPPAVGEDDAGAIAVDDVDDDELMSLLGKKYGLS